MADDVAGLIDRIIRDVAELPDRTSPEDWPEAMLVTAGELRGIIGGYLADLSARLETTAWEATQLKNLHADLLRDFNDAEIRATRAREALRPWANAPDDILDDATWSDRMPVTFERGRWVIARDAETFPCTLGDLRGARAALQSPPPAEVQKTEPPSELWQPLPPDPPLPPPQESAA